MVELTLKFQVCLCRCFTVSWIMSSVCQRLVRVSRVNRVTSSRECQSNEPPLPNNWHAKEALANRLRLTPELLQLETIRALANGTKACFGESVSNIFSKNDLDVFPGC